MSLLTDFWRALRAGALELRDDFNRRRRLRRFHGHCPF